MNTREIQNILSESVPKSFHATVLAADQLKTVKSQQFACVVNNQTSDEPGMHWLAVFKKKVVQR